MSLLQGISLSLPALLLAGLAASPHCAAMCGAIAGGAVDTAASRGCSALRAGAWLHLGRLTVYSLLGALAGGAGAWLMQLPAADLGSFPRMAAGALLVGIGLLRLRQSARACGQHGVAKKPVIPLRALAAAPERLSSAPTTSRPARRPLPGSLSSGLLLGGGLWALLPCPMLYAVLSLAALTASAWNGALLLLAFGTGTLLTLAPAGWLMRGGGHPRAQQAAALALCAFGLVAIVSGVSEGPAQLLAWCRAAVSAGGAG